MAEDVTVIFGSLQECLKSLRDHEVQTNTRYAVGYSSKGFGKRSTGSNIVNKKRVQWLNGKPFISLGFKVYFCHHGKNYRPNHNSRSPKEHGYSKGERVHAQQTKKLGCPAKVLIKEGIMLPNSHNVLTSKQKKTVARQVRANVDAGTKGFLLRLPSIEDHSFHVTGKEAGLTQPIDKELIDAIVQFIDEGVYDSPSMKQHLEQYVLRCHPAILPTNRRFYPTIRTIQNHMHKALRIKFPNGEHKVKVKGSRQRAEGSKRKHRTGVTKKKDHSTKHQTKVKPPTQWNPKVNIDGTMIQQHYIDDTADHEDEVVQCPPDDEQDF
ncbi:uncharacterized protein LOC127865611 [Dreissena polymorpha]|uniref:uncharacterized protein LOC127865611 n=1 Tax=Dreissena polymorpha TaxID=45954 RepID=UPI0022649696|nr:uncharacterized protein LOC127865611 [Dreissena polymorpha]